ncbi:PREDICTED: uncharacterized protein LOC109181111 [Ipomoea nil]|uniref:uncharacterized protein LOC109181111 n=1 Tax=Ipomoea nil TaxID=35883 RepID=UPI000900901C|nr:PREDICTED: uncharacterized protein LOC109181111 [Ipomoea nil]
MPPQVDLETLVSACAGGGTDRKIACETLVEDNAADKEDSSDDDDAGREAPPDFPPESFWLSKDAELDWFDRNAFLERKESAKGINSNSNPTTAHPNLNPGSNSSSQRFLKSKASLLFGLPKTQKMNYVWKTCSKPANIRLFPAKRTESIGKVVAEPSSPKVSCMGRVRSKRGCRKSLSTGEKPTEDHAETGGDKRRTGFYSRLLSMFRTNRSHKPAKKIEAGPKREEPEPEPGRKSVKAAKMRDVPISAEPVPEPPGLGGMRRLSSARKSECWAAEEIKAAISEAFETERRRGGHNG